MKDKVLITGASGFIGYHLVEACLHAGLEVSAAVRPSSDVAHFADLNLKYVTPAFGNADELRRHIAEGGYDYVIHAAGITRAKTQDDYNKVNAEYTRNLAQAVKDTQVKKFIFLSSLAAIGPTVYDDPNPITEERTPQPVTSYGRSKLLAEQYLNEIEIPKIIFRPTAVYGPREKDIFIVFKTLASRIEPYIGRGAQTLSFIHGQDIADVVVKAMYSDIADATYNLSDGKKYDKYELANIIKKELGRSAFRLHVPMGIARLIAASLEQLYKNSDKAPTLNKEKLAELAAENWNCSIERVQKDLGFTPRFDLYSGVANTVQWYKNNNWL